MTWNHTCSISRSHVTPEIGLLGSHLPWGPLNSETFSSTPAAFQLSQSAANLWKVWPFQVSHSLDSLPGRSTCEAHGEESDWHMKGSQSARTAAEDGPRKHCPHSAPSKEEKALYWEGNDPAGPAVMWRLCFSSLPPNNFQRPRIQYLPLIYVWLLQ